MYDLAVLQIDARQAPAGARSATRDDLIVGEWAIAIGNPFGFLLNDPPPSVTVGRDQRDAPRHQGRRAEGGIYKNMIQTDAAINPGNSGGPLVNVAGEVIGVNTFIFTRGGGSLGIGFAIPIDDARSAWSTRSSATAGSARVWIGMQVQPVTPYLAERLERSPSRAASSSRGVERGARPTGPASGWGTSSGRERRGRCDTAEDAQRRSSAPRSATGPPSPSSATGRRVDSVR